MTASLPRLRRGALAALVVMALTVGCKKKQPDPAPDSDTPAPGVVPVAPGASAPSRATAPANGPPDGWSEVRDPIGGFRVYVPGPSRAVNMTGAPAEYQQVQMVMYQNSIGPKGKGSMVTTYSLVPLAGFKIGSSQDELFAGLLQHQKGMLTFNEVVSKEPVTLGGRPGLKAVVKEKVGTPPKFPDDPEAEQRIAEGYKKNAARRRVYFVTTTATRVIVIMVQSEGEPNPAELKTVAESFAFL